MQINLKRVPKPVYTATGIKSQQRSTPLQALQRLVLSCFLFEKEFYIDGKRVSERIIELCNVVPDVEIVKLATEARNEHNLRHVSLLLLLALVNKRSVLASKAIDQVIQRPDELTELLALYWKDGKVPLSAQLKKGLALAFGKFNEYSLAKYNRDTIVTLRDVMFLSHPKPKDKAREALYKRVANNALVTPDTWETELSAGKGKKETFTRLIKEGKLGYLALLRNLRGMEQTGVDRDLIRKAIMARKGAERVMPFRYIAAARAAPSQAMALNSALLQATAEMEQFKGETIIMVDVSGSMHHRLSAQSDMTRADAAAGLASIFPGNARVFSFADRVKEVPAYKGLPGIEAINKSQSGGTKLFDAVHFINNHYKYDRLIVITDEQETGGTIKSLEQPTGKGYMINVASNQVGVAYGDWVRLNGFSESILTWIKEYERLEQGVV